MPSENGWEPSRASASQCEWVRIPGAEHVSLQFLKGQPSKILRAFAADFNAYIEPLRDHDSAAYTPTNSVATSNHLNGTAMDLNWQLHPFRVHNAGFDAAAIARIRDLLAFYTFEGLPIIFWGNDWRSPKDAMHWNLSYNTYQRRDVLDRFIAQRIRPDGFSTYRRGAPAPPPSPPPPPALSKQDRYALAVMAEGRRRGITPRGIQIAFATVFVESNWKMYANRNVPASLKLPHDAVGSDHDSVGLFQQRHPMWGPLEVLMDPAKSAGLFFDRLAKMDYNDPSRLPGSFAADVQRPAAQYRGRYQERMGDAVALYNRLAGTSPPPTPGEDELSAEAERKIDVIYRELTQRHPSRSPLRHLGEGAVDTVAGFTLNTDGSQHVEIVKLLASLGHPESLALLREVANADPAKYPDRQPDKLIAQAILAEVTAAPTSPSVSASPAYPVDGGELARLREENMRLREENMRLQQQQVSAEPASAELATVGAQEAKTSGQRVGALVDTVEDWTELALSMDVKQRAALAASLKVLQIQNGAS